MEWYYKTYHRRLLENFLKKYTSKMQGKILDVGSKNRRYDNLLPGSIITAIDIIPNPEKNVLAGNIEERLPFNDESFDGALCIEVLEYVKNYSNALHELQRILSSNGKALISVPFVYHAHDDKLRYTKEFLREELSQLFSKVEIITFGNSWVIIGDILRKKVLSIRFRLIKYLCFIFILPYLGCIKLLHLDKKEDQYYSGMVCFVTK